MGYGHIYLKPFLNSCDRPGGRSSYCVPIVLTGSIRIFLQNISKTFNCISRAFFEAIVPKMFILQIPKSIKGEKIHHREREVRKEKRG